VPEDDTENEGADVGAPEGAPKGSDKVPTPDDFEEVDFGEGMVSAPIDVLSNDQRLQFYTRECTYISNY